MYKYKNMIKLGSKKIIILFCTFIVISGNFSVFLANGVKLNSKNENLEDNFGEQYIIRFRQDSLSSYRKKIINNFIRDLSDRNLKNLIKEKINNHKNKIYHLHSKALSDIQSIVDNNFKPQNVLKHFKSLFSGIVVKNIAPEKVPLIESLSYVDSVTLDTKLKIYLDDSVPLINADDVWKLHSIYGKELKGDGINVGIFDTGIDYNHPDLVDNYIGGYDFVNDDSDPLDDNGHGTQCAGIVQGVAPKVNLFGFKIMDKDGAGYSSDVQIALDYVLDPNEDGDFSDRLVDIVSMSFGILNEEKNPDSPLCLEIDSAAENGILSCIAAGNNGTEHYNTINFPSMARKAICVGATDKSDNIAYFSSRGPVEWNEKVLVKPDLVAPGVNIRTTSKGGGYSSPDGTSFSTPHVAGVAALLMQAYPDWSPEKVKNALKRTALDIGEDEYTQGAGRVDVLSAVNLSSAPPIVSLDMPFYFDEDVIQINGTAMNGTGNSTDFINYTVYYREQNEWIKIYESNKEIKEAVLYTWNANEIDPGIYEIKLFVRSKDQASFDTKKINIGLKELFIKCDDTISEKEEFNVELFDHKMNPTNALVIFKPRFHFPQIKYGNKISFISPRILNPMFSDINGKIIVLKIDPFEFKTKKILLKNQ